MKIEEWIIDNLNNCGNCALPNKLVRQNGIHKVEEELTKLAGYTVQIDKRIVDSYAYSAVATLNQRMKKETIYIAIRL